MQSRKHGKAFTSLLLPIGNTRWEEEGEGNKQCLVVVPETAKKYNHCEILDAAFWGWERGGKGERKGSWWEHRTIPGVLKACTKY